MIKSRFDKKVKEVKGGDILLGHIDVVFEGTDEIFKGWIWDFKADNGIQEIAEAIETANMQKPKCEGCGE